MGCFRAQNVHLFFLFFTFIIAVQPSMSRFRLRDISDEYEDAISQTIYDDRSPDNSEVAMYYGKEVMPLEEVVPLGELVPLEERWGPGNSPPDGSTLAVDTFERIRKKHARPLFYLNCSLRSQCYCYSKASRHHYCCSCDVGACFPGEALLATPQGSTIPMNMLKTGDSVLAASDDGQLVSTEILGFLDRRPFEMASYVTVTTATGQNLTLSGNHVLFKTSSNFSTRISDYAQNIVEGDTIFVMTDTGLGLTEVKHISYPLQIGAFVPLTKEGTIIVNGFLVSCYASFPHSLAHSFMAPIRTFPGLLRFRSSGKPSERLFDPAEEEGYGEASYVSFIKMIGSAFFDSRRAPLDVLQVKTFPEERPIWRSPLFPLDNPVAQLLEISTSLFQ